MNATMAEGTKHPKLLPRREHLTALLITEVQQRLIHAGVAHTLAQLREEYWILQEGQRLEEYCLNVYSVED